MFRKLLYSALVIVLSVVLSASAFAQTQTTDQQTQSGDSSTTGTISSGSSSDPSTGSADPSTPPPSDGTLASMPDSVCPAVLNPLVVEHFRVMAPTLVARCEAL
ncbi:MAG: hypothetical protein QOI57_3358 [Rubrobacteraceae bacterium]|nr:hypothetical protein [Rubrobacteraceae bacterium]